VAVELNIPSKSDFVQINQDLSILASDERRKEQVSDGNYRDSALLGAGAQLNSH
jgi:hypothetical protein